MDRIEELIKKARPHVVVPDGHSGSGGAAGKAGGEWPPVTDDSRPPVTELISAAASRPATGRSSRTALRMAVAGLAAAAVITGGVVAGTLGRPVSAPAPAASQETSATATPTPTVPVKASPTAAAPATATSPVPSSARPARSAPAATAVAPPAETPMPAEPSPPIVTPTGSAPLPLPAGWSTYASPGGTVRFDHPGTWSVLPNASSFPDMVNVSVKDQAGKLMATLTYGGAGGLGGACRPDPVPYTVLDFATVDVPYNPQIPDSVTPRFAFRAMPDGGGVVASYGLTSTVGGQDGKACMIYNVVNGPPSSSIYMFASAVQMSLGDYERGGALTFTSMDEARAYMGTPEYAAAKRMIMSLRISDG